MLSYIFQQGEESSEGTATRPTVAKAQPEGTFNIDSPPDLLCESFTLVMWASLDIFASFSELGSQDGKAHCPAGHACYCWSACSEAEAELFIAWQSFLAISVFFRYYRVIKAHQEFLASASNVVWLVGTIQKWESGLKNLNYGVH